MYNIYIKYLYTMSMYSIPPQNK